MQQIKWAPFEVDVTDAMMLLRHVTKPLPWLPEDSANLELTAVSQGKVRGCRAFTMAVLLGLRAEAVSTGDSARQSQQSAAACPVDQLQVAFVRRSAIQYRSGWSSTVFCVPFRRGWRLLC